MSETSFDASVQPIEILLVEDNLGDARLIQETLKEGKIRNHLRLAKDGQFALDSLRTCLSETGIHLPDLILLDLNLPRMDGWELLQILRADAELMRIPVIILTSSASEQDIRRSQDLAANCFLTKPVAHDALLKAILSVGDFWCTLVKLSKG